MAGETGFSVYRADADCTNEVDITPVGGHVPPDVLTFPDLSPLEGTHCYFVRAFDGGGESPDSNHVLVTYDTAPPITPDAPGGLTPAASPPTISISSTNDPAAPGGSSGVHHYDVYRDGSQVNVAPILETGSGPYAWSDDGLHSSSPVSVSGVYSYTVVAVDAAGNASPQSLPKDIAVDANAPGTPAAPSGTSPVATAPVITISTVSDPIVGGVSTGVDHYDVYRNGSPTPTGPQVPAGGPYTWTDTGAVASGTYSYTVVAVDAVGNASAHSPAGSIVFDVTAPSTPGTPTGLSPVAAAPTINFTSSTDANSGVDHYDVYRNGSPTPTGPQVPAGGPFTWSDTGVVASGTYSYTVVAVDAVGNASAHSPAGSIVFDVTAPSTPGTPTGLSPVAAAPTINFTSSTDANSGVDHYDVYRNGSPTPTGPQVPAGGPYTWTDTGAVASGTYSYTVVAVDAVGNASAHSPAGTVVRDANAPGTPAAPSGTSPVATAPVITISTVSDPIVGGVSTGVDHYDVYRNGSPTPTGPQVPAGGPYTWTDTGAVASGTYSYTVVAVDAVGNASAHSPAGTVVRDANAPGTPAAPSGTSPVATAPVITISTVSDPIVGGVSTGVDHYDVYRNGSPTPTGPQVPAGGPFTWSDTGAVASGTYSYTVVAVDAVGNASAHSPAGSIVFDVTAPSTPGTPTGLSPVAAAPTINFTSSTDANSGVDHYDVYRNGSPTPTGPQVPAGGPFTWSDTAVVAPGTYSYTVVAVDAVGNASAHSPAGTIDVNPALSAPTSVTALATPTTQRPQISWVAPAAPGFPIHHYKIYRNGQPLSDVSGTTFTDNTAARACRRRYTYQIVAFDSAASRNSASSPLR